MKFILLCLLMLLSTIALGFVTPEQNENWTVTKNWIFEQEIYVFQARNESLLQDCKIHPGFYIKIPAVVQVSHKILVDEIVVANHGSSDLRSVKSYFGSPLIPCNNIQVGNELVWEVYSLAETFSKIKEFPELVESPPVSELFQETFNVISAGTLIVLSIFCLVIFYGKVENSLSICLSLSCIFFSLYFLATTSGFFHINFPMIILHKVGDICLIFGVSLYFYCLRVKHLINVKVFKIYIGILFISCMIIVLADNLEFAQIGTSIMFVPTMFLLLYSFILKIKESIFEGFSQYSFFLILSYGIFVFAGFNDILYVEGIVDSAMLLSIGILSAMMFFALSINTSIIETYTERDYLRGNLENEVVKKTNELYRTLDDLKLTQSELMESSKQLEKEKLNAEGAAKIAVEANKNKDVFLANISHELRTPLTLILTPLEGMLQNAKRFDSHNYNTMEKMHDNGLSLLRQINDLLDLTRLQDGRLSLRFKEVGIVDLIGSIVSRVSATAEKKGITVVFNTKGDVNQLYLDPDKFEKIIINLISNALKFTPRGGRIDIVVRGTTDGVQVDVSDTGIGIPEDQREAVFERFVQVDGTNTRQYGGTGIGLSLVKDIVKLHGGEVSVVSEEGQGSTFSLQLLKGTAHINDEDMVDQETDTGDEVEALKYSRLVKSADFVDDAEQDIAPLVAELQVGCESTIKLLIVEDNPDMYRLVANVLCQDYLVDIACNGEQGLVKARAILPDIIVSDVMMPKMTGIEMLFEIRHDFQLEHIPVILLSSKADISNKIVGLEKGADDYIAKPFNPRELQARIKTLLIHHQYERQLAQKNNALQTANTTLEQAMKDLADSQAQLVHTERLATVGQLAANVAHEINTPLFSAKNCVSVLARKLTTEREKDIVATLSGVLQDIQRQVQSMLGFSRKNQEKGFEWVDIHDGLNDTLTLLQFQLDDIGITVHREFAVSEKVEVDIQQLNQVFLNILNNAIYAIQAKSAKGGHLWVTTSIEHDWLKLSIRDDGCGMSSDVVAQVFDPFYTTKASGTGLGLAICRQIIITTHSGDIVVESEVGEGTTFTITVPVSQAVDAQLKSA